MNVRMGFFEVAKNSVRINHSLPAQDFAVNLNKWSALPADLKSIVGSCVREWTWDQIQRIAVEDTRATADIRAKGGTAAVLPDGEFDQTARTRPEDLGRVVEEIGACPKGLRLAARLAQGTRNPRMTAGQRPRDDGIDDGALGAGRAAPPPGPEGAIARFCSGVDRLNEAVGWLLGPFIIFIAAAICYEVVSRGVLNQGTVWVAETAVYGSSAVYLLVGGYALLHRRHVRIDLLLGALSPRLTQWLELAMFPFLVALCRVAAAGRLATRLDVVRAIRGDRDAVESGGSGRSSSAFRWPGCCCCCRRSRTCSAIWAWPLRQLPTRPQRRRWARTRGARPGDASRPSRC